jgi:serine protease Do
MAPPVCKRLAVTRPRGNGIGIAQDEGSGTSDPGTMNRSITLALSLLVAASCSPEPDNGTAWAAGGAAPAAGFRDVVDDVLPSIVFIQAEVPAPAGLEALLPQGHPMVDEPYAVGFGSGVIYTDDGYILTNNHVVQDAERVIVVLHDRRHMEARVVGRDPSTEVAVVKIEGRGFPVARLGDSDAVRIGDWALAMGSPLGLQFTVTAGIVSGIGRDIGILRRPDQGAAERTAPLEHFIQTDAALSPGNSGGPLLNVRGEVIGINTAVAGSGGGPSGYGFAIPSNLARHVADQLVRHGEVRRSYLGVYLTNVTPEIARQLGLERVAGAVVGQMEEGGPAHRAGVREDEIIIGLGDDPVVTVSDLQARLAQLEPGTTMALHVLREGRARELSVELGVVSTVLPGSGQRERAGPQTLAPERLSPR